MNLKFKFKLNLNKYYLQRKQNVKTDIGREECLRDRILFFQKRLKEI